MKKTSWSGRGRRTSFCLLLATGVALAMGASASEQIEKIPCPSWVVLPGATCAKVKRHPLDPEAVFGDDWKHSDWAYTQEFADRLQVKDRGQVTKICREGWPRLNCGSLGIHSF